MKYLKRAKYIHTSSFLWNRAPSVNAEPTPSKPQKAATSAASPPSSTSQPTAAQFDIRVGKIVEVQRHPNADTFVSFLPGKKKRS
jgi:tRNA-binding EMAP/Myf-like protein